MKTGDSFRDLLKRQFPHQFGVPDNSKEKVKPVKDDESLQSASPANVEEQNRYYYPHIIEDLRAEISINFDYKQERLDLLLKKALKVLDEVSSEKTNLTLRKNKQLKEENENLKRDLKYSKEDLNAQTENYLRLVAVVEFLKKENGQIVKWSAGFFVLLLVLILYHNRTVNTSNHLPVVAVQNQKPTANPSPLNPPELLPKQRNTAKTNGRRKTVRKK